MSPSPPPPSGYCRWTFSPCHGYLHPTIFALLLWPYNFSFVIVISFPFARPLSFVISWPPMLRHEVPSLSPYYFHSATFFLFTRPCYFYSSTLTSLHLSPPQDFIAFARHGHLSATTFPSLVQPCHLLPLCEVSLLSLTMATIASQLSPLYYSTSLSPSPL